MEKKVRKFAVYHDFTDWHGTISIDHIQDDIAELIESGATHLKFDGADICAFCERVETDEEYDQRMAFESNRKNALKNYELKELERLRQKYGV